MLHSTCRQSQTIAVSDCCLTASDNFSLKLFYILPENGQFCQLYRHSFVSCIPRYLPTRRCTYISRCTVHSGIPCNTTTYRINCRWPASVKFIERVLTRLKNLSLFLIIKQQSTLTFHFQSNTGKDNRQAVVTSAIRRKGAPFPISNLWLKASPIQKLIKTCGNGKGNAGNRFLIIYKILLCTM